MTQTHYFLGHSVSSWPAPAPPGGDGGGVMHPRARGSDPRDPTPV